MLKRFAQIAGLALTLGLAAVPAAHADTRFSLRIGTGPIAVAPPGYVWQPAYRVWTGYGYRWVPGAWVPAPYLRGHHDARAYRDWDRDRRRDWDRGRGWERRRDNDYDRHDWRYDRDDRR